MFCIAAFIVFAVLALFSASYRPLAAKAWHCVGRRVTFRPCDIDFSEEVKGRLIGSMVISHPHVAKFLSRWIDGLSFLFVALSIWSVLYLGIAGLNLWVYGTCRPGNVESCSLSGEACGIDQSSLGFIQAVSEGKISVWAAGPFVRFSETILRIPDRLRHWEAKDYLSSTATYYTPEDPKMPYAIEVMDPGCKFCKKLLHNIHTAGLEKSHNLSYVLYAIPNPSPNPIPSPNPSPISTKFPHSDFIARVIEATKHYQLQSNPSGIPPDWQLIEKIFSEKPGDTVDWQTYINIAATKEEVPEILKGFLQEIGYSVSDTAEILRFATSDTVSRSIADQKKLVEEDLRTIKIPTLVVGGRRYDRVVGAKVLRGVQ